jgi:spermidine/putrescine transport system permease protein
MTLSRSWQAIWGAFVACTILFMLLPLILVVVFSFNRSALTSFPLTGFTFDWYRRLAAHESFWPAFSNSLIVAAAVAVLTVIIGTLAAYGLAQARPSLSQGILSFLTAPMMMPSLLIGIALLSFFVRILGAPLGLWTVVLGHLVVIQPFVITVLYARLASFDWSLVESARDLGASPLIAFVTITLPAIRPSIVGAALLALSLSLDEFVISFFTIGSGNTLPTLVWGLVRTSLDPTINAIATLLIAISISSTALALYVSKYRG